MRCYENSVFAVALFLLCLSTAHTQQRPAYGALANLNLNNYSADFRGFPGVPSCCPLYEDGTGSGVTLGLLYEVPLSSRFRLALRAGYSSRSGALTRLEEVVVSGNIPGTFEHQVDARLADIGLEPLLQFNPFASLWFNLGTRVALVSTSSFSQKESIVTPTNGVFPNGQSTRNVLTDQPIPSASSIYSAVLMGLSYDLPLNAKRTIILAPEIIYSLGISPVVSGLDWNSNSLRVGFALKYSPEPSKEPIERIEQIPHFDTVRNVRPIAEATETFPSKNNDGTFSVSVVASGVETDGVEKQTVKLQVEEFSSVLMTPLLNYIFFDANSSVIPSRYRMLRSTETEKFVEQQINNSDRLSTYYHILNIVGKRMRQHPTATITLVGCNADIGAEKGNLALSKLRAESVKEYLSKLWNIAGSRVTITTRNLPDKAAMSVSEEGYQENRRVEIIASSPSIIVPIITNDTLRKANPPSVRFRPQVTSKAVPVRWLLTAEQGGTILKTFEGTGSVPNLIDWNMEQDGTHPRTEEGLTYTLSVTYDANKTVHASNVIPVEQITIHRKQIERRDDKEINRYSLILFDVRSSEITAVNKPIIELIGKGITPTSTVNVSGYTDRLGDAVLNQSLAEGRAKATADALRIPGNRTKISSKGNAETYNPKLPEGRLYTRTVDVVIETPIKE